VKAALKRVIPALLCFILLTGSSISAESFVQSSRAREISQLIWTNQFDDALDSSSSLLSTDSTQLFGHLFLGITYYSICNQYRTDRYVDLATAQLDTTIAIALTQTQLNPKLDDADLLFVLGSAYAFRAVLRGQFGGWWGAMKDGGRAAASLGKAVAMDSTLYDAYLGLGTYHYWKSAKAKHFAWLLFIKDRRKQGIQEITRASLLGTITPMVAQRSLVVIYMNENRYSDARTIADSILKVCPLDPVCLMYLAQSMLETKEWDNAEGVTNRLREQWQLSRFRDPCGIKEADYLQARILLGRGQSAEAATLLASILAAKDSCGSNAFYDETRDDAKSVSGLAQ